MGTNKWSPLSSIVLGLLSNPLLSLVSVQVMLCLHFILSIQRCLVCFCVFFLQILRVVRCVEFGQLALFLHVQTIGVFVTRLCLAGLYTCRLNLPSGVRTLEETRIIVCRLLTRFIFHLKITESRKIPENAQCNEIRIAVDKTVRATKDLLYTLYIIIYIHYTLYTLSIYM